MVESIQERTRTGLDDQCWIILIAKSTAKQSATGPHGHEFGYIILQKCGVCVCSDLKNRSTVDMERLPI